MMLTLLDEHFSARVSNSRDGNSFHSVLECGYYSGHKGVVTRVRCSGIFNYKFITNLLLILLVKKKIENRSAFNKVIFWSRCRNLHAVGQYWDSVFRH